MKSDAISAFQKYHKMVGFSVANFCLRLAQGVRNARFAVSLYNEPLANKNPTVIQPLAAQNPA